jgi:hypothetical protein
MFGGGEGWKNVMELSDKVLVSDIKDMNGLIYVSSFPKGLITVLDGDFKVRKSIHFTNDYIWNIIPDTKGYYVLAGNPALLYHFNKNDESDLSLPVSGEDNLLRGIPAPGGDLFISAGGNVLYKYTAKERKIRAVYSFDNPVMDMCYADGLIYIITSASGGNNNLLKDPDTPLPDDNTAARQPERIKSLGSLSFKSSLYSYDMGASVEKLFEKANIRFISLSYFKDSIIIGTDKDAGYYQISLKGRGSDRKFSGLGAGKFARLTSLNGINYALLLEPSRIIKLSEGYAGNGTIISGAFDTGGISRWGRPFIAAGAAGAGMKVFTRSGAFGSRDGWEDWEECIDIPVSSPGRYFQYKIELTGVPGGMETPVFNGISFPYIQKNSAPRIEKLSVNYNNNLFKITWDAQDDDKDILIYNLYLSRGNGGWVKINERPLEDNSFDINPVNFPEGQYRLKLTASDERSNPPEEAREVYKVSELFSIVNSIPVIGDISCKMSGNTAEIAWKVSDAFSPLAEVDYMHNGLKWIKIIPSSGIFDASKSLEFSLKIRIDSPSFIVIKAVDIYGNYSTRGIFAPGQ